jgi:hypothetical protein
VVCSPGPLDFQRRKLSVFDRRAFFVRALVVGKPKMAKIIKVAEVQRRRARVKVSQGAEVQRRQRANNTLAIVIRLRKGFDKVITEVLADQDSDAALTVLHAAVPALTKILLTRMSADELDALIKGIRSRNLPGL